MARRLVAGRHRIAYTDHRNDDLRAVVVRPDGHRLWSRRGAFASWSPRGDRAALVTFGDRRRTVITTAAGRRLARVAGQALAWAPDGRRLLVARPDDSTAPGWIGLVRANGRTVRKIGDFWFGGAFSPDGSSIAFAGVRGSRAGVFVLGHDGALRRRIDVDADFARWATSAAGRCSSRARAGGSRSCGRRGTSRARSSGSSPARSTCTASRPRAAAGSCTGATRRRRPTSG